MTGCVATCVAGIEHSESEGSFVFDGILCDNPRTIFRAYWADSSRALEVRGRDMEWRFKLDFKPDMVVHARRSDLTQAWLRLTLMDRAGSGSNWSHPRRGVAMSEEGAAREG
jgi:hypothetical protein